jgi:hypothetical protein
MGVGLLYPYTSLPTIIFPVCRMVIGTGGGCGCSAQGAWCISMPQLAKSCVTGTRRRSEHFHVYDTTGEVMCVDAAMFRLTATDGLQMVTFYEHESLMSSIVATFNWSNVVCVREEEDDDDDVSPTPVPDYLQGMLN